MAKGKGPKGKSKKGASQFPSPSSTASFVQLPSDVMANVGSPGYTGCFICGDKGHSYHQCPRQSGGKGKGFGKPAGKIFMVLETEATQLTQGPGHAVPQTSWQVPAYLPQLGQAEILTVSSPRMEGFRVLDTGATESVTSLEALDYIVNRRCELFGAGDHVQVVPGPAKNFRFGNGSTQVSESFVLLSQRLGKRVVSVGLYTIDATGVPLLLGIRTLEKLGAVVDCSRAAMVLKTIHDTLVIPLKRSSAGHLLLDMCSSDWLHGGAKVLYAETQVLEQEKNREIETAFMVSGEENLDESTSCAPARPCLTCTVDVAHELSSSE